MVAASVDHALVVYSGIRQPLLDLCCCLLMTLQAILRAIFGYFMAVPLDTVPRLDIPLHTLIGKDHTVLL